MRKLIVSGLFVSIGLFLGRIAGFLREAYIASKFGASEQTDLIIVFLSTPDILVNLLVGGALGMALIPEFKSLSRKNATLLYQQVFLTLFFVFLILGGIGALYSSTVLKLLAPGFSYTTIQNYSPTFSITFVAIPLSVAAGVTTAYLHYNNKFFIASLGTLIFNLIIILSLYFSSYVNENIILFVISIGVCIAAFLRWLSQSVTTKISPISRLSLSRNLISSSLIKRYFYCVLTGGIIFIIPVIARALGSQNGSGELSLINYAIKLVEFPLGVLLTVFSIIFFPYFAELYAKNDEKEFLFTFNRVLLIVIIISMSVFIPLNHFSSAITHLIYDWGQLKTEQLYKISDYLKAVSLTLPFQGVNALLVAVLAARRDTFNPLVISSFLVIFFITVGYVFITNISDIFNLMVFVYATFTFSLLVIVAKKHHISFLSKNVFIIEFLKVIAISLFYYLLLTQISISQFLWMDLLIASISSVVFLLTCAYCCSDTRQIIKIRRGS